MLRITDNVIAECNNEVYTVKDCTASASTAFCQLSSGSSCARELHADGVAHCEAQPSSLDPITYVDDGIIIINDNTAKVQIDNSTEVWMDGTHLISFTQHATINE